MVSPLRAIEEQKKSLDIAIKQHEGEPEIQNALRKQKDQLGGYEEQLKPKATNIQDGGNVLGAKKVHAGEKASILATGARLTTKGDGKKEE